MRSSWELFRDVRAESAAASSTRAEQGPTTTTWPVSDSASSAGLGARRAVKDFEDAPLDPAQLERLCASVRRADLDLWPGAPQASPLRVLVAVRNVDSLRPGVHEHLDGGLQLLAPVDDEEFLDGLVLQPEFAAASAIVVVAGSLAAAVAVDGEHGYRLLLERAGAACQTAWLSAVGQGLDGCIFAGLLPSGLAALLGFDGYYSTQLLAFAVGHERAADR